jgi:putative ABC transport system permease protein
MRRTVNDLAVAWRNVWRHPRRTSIVLAAIVGGVVAMLLAGGFIEWIFHDLRESTIHSRLGHIEIVRPGYFAHGKSEPSRYLLPAASSELGVVAGTPHVRVVARRLSFSGLVSHGETTVSFEGDGIEPEAEQSIGASMKIIEGTNLGARDLDGVLLGEGLARSLGVRVGDRIVLLVSRRNGGVNAAELTLRGTFASVTKAYDDYALRLHLAVAQRLLDTMGASMWVVLLDDTGMTDVAVRALRSALPAGRFEVVPWHALADFYAKTVTLFSRQFSVVEAIIAMIIVLSIGNTMMMSVMERTWEIGTSMALGVPRLRILAGFILESMVLGVVGAGAVIMWGCALATLISSIGIPMPPPPGMAHGYVGAIRLTPALAFESIALGFITAVIAAVYPAWRAAHLPIVDALRHAR